MKKLFINTTGGQEKIDRALEVAKVIFNEDELNPICFDSKLSLRENVELLLGCDYYFAIEGVWCLKDAGGDRDRLDTIARRLFDNAEIFHIDRAQFYTNEEWNEAIDRRECCDEVEAGY